MKMKQSREYFISTEGETEVWYFEHLKKLINESEEPIFKLEAKPKVNISPKSFTKNLKVTSTAKAFHICDYESKADQHVIKFENVLKELKEAKGFKSGLSYALGYSNYTFELWMILHKKQLIGPVSDRKDYLPHINAAYNENFKHLHTYKEEKNFKRILSKIELNDVKMAIRNANKIREMHSENGKSVTEYSGFRYYKDNPDLTIDECVKRIFKEFKISLT